jgi:hypothetical protein
VWHQAGNGVAIVESGNRMRGIVPKKYSTSTLIDSASCVPWLPAEGPLAYTPENPPVTDYSFQYSWILPEIFNSNVHKTSGQLQTHRPAHRLENIHWSGVARDLTVATEMVACRSTRCAADS